MKTKNGYDTLGQTIILIGLLIAIAIVSPLITIWSLNTLFHTSIEYSMWTYLAALWVTGLVAGNGVRSK